MRNKIRTPVEFQRLLREYAVPESTAYKWAAGDHLPSGKYMAVYEYFIKETGLAVDNDGGS